jgi:type IV pilus assembly protein PilW
MSYDLLQPQPGAGAAPDASIADGVVEMRAVYGLDTNADGILDTWVDPSVSSGSGFDATELSNGSASSRAKLRQIIAVRVGLILRTSLQERSPSATASSSSSLGPETFEQASGTVLTLFTDLPTAVQQTRTLTTTSGELNYRFRAVEFTVPLRNVLMAPPT